MKKLFFSFCFIVFSSLFLFPSPTFATYTGCRTFLLAFSNQISITNWVLQPSTIYAYQQAYANSNSQSDAYYFSLTRPSSNYSFSNIGDPVGWTHTNDADTITWITSTNPIKATYELRPFSFDLTTTSGSHAPEQFIAHMGQQVDGSDKVQCANDQFISIDPSGYPVEIPLSVSNIVVDNNHIAFDSESAGSADVTYWDMNDTQTNNTHINSDTNIIHHNFSLSGLSDFNNYWYQITYTNLWGASYDSGVLSFGHPGMCENIPTSTPSVTPTITPTTTPSITPTPPRQLTALTPANVWIGLKNNSDSGTKFDVKAEVYVTRLVSTGQVTGVSGGVGFNNAVLGSIPLSLQNPVDFPVGSGLSIKLYVRNTCSGNTTNSGIARLWYNDSEANSKFGASIDSILSSYYLVENLGLSSTTGTGPKQNLDTDAGSPCSSYKLFNTWSQ
jgi:hypothetical protein